MVSEIKVLWKPYGKIGYHFSFLKFNFRLENSMDANKQMRLTQ